MEEYPVSVPKLSGHAMQLITRQSNLRPYLCFSPQTIGSRDATKGSSCPSARSCFRFQSPNYRVTRCNDYTQSSSAQERGLFQSPNYRVTRCNRPLPFSSAPDFTTFGGNGFWFQNHNFSKIDFLLKNPPDLRKFKKREAKPINF